MKIFAIGILSTLFFPTVSWSANVDMKNLFKCQNGILPQNGLIKITRKETVESDGLISTESYSRLVNTKDKCFKIATSELVYLIDKDQAIYKVHTDDYSNPWIMVDFNKKRAPLDGFVGVVKGVGKYTYKDGKGIPRNIPYMIVIK